MISLLEYPASYNVLAQICATLPGLYAAPAVIYQLNAQNQMAAEEEGQGHQRQGAAQAPARGAHLGDQPEHGHRQQNGSDDRMG